MLRVCIVMIFAVQTAFCFPQDDKQGQVGVSFGGFYAQAGGGPDGLSASAGTPSGQSAKAGIGGSTSGSISGGAFAEANAGPDIGASAALNGQVNGNQAVYTKKVVYTSNVNTGSATVVKQSVDTAPPPQQDKVYSYRKVVTYPEQNTNTYTKTKQVRYQPPVGTYRKTYRFRPFWSKQFIVAPIQPEPVAEKVAPAPVETSTGQYRKEVRVNGNGYKLFDAIFQIPIVTLKAVNNLVNQATSGGIVYTKSVRVD